MKKMVCDCCGGQVSDRGRCLYCGTLYEVTPQWFDLSEHVIIERPEIRTFVSQCTITAEAQMHYGKGAGEHYARKQMCMDLAKLLFESGMVQVRYEDDPCRMSTRYRATLRAVAPWTGGD